MRWVTTFIPFFFIFHHFSLQSSHCRCLVWSYGLILTGWFVLGDHAKTKLSFVNHKCIFYGVIIVSTMRTVECEACVQCMTPPWWFDWLINCLINFNGISIYLQLFYVKGLENCVHCTFIFTFFLLLFLKSFLLFTHSPIAFKCFLNRSIWLIDGTLVGTTTPGQTEPGSNSNPLQISRTGALPSYAV